jgi:hypothetical protein
MGLYGTIFKSLIFENLNNCLILENLVNNGIYDKSKKRGFIMYHIILWVSLILLSVISITLFNSLFFGLLFFLIFSLNVAYNFIN